MYFSRVVEHGGRLSHNATKYNIMYLCLMQPVATFTQRFLDNWHGTPDRDLAPGTEIYSVASCSPSQATFTLISQFGVLPGQHWLASQAGGLQHLK
ncbi:hypothetical protein RRG08_049603 [Elysia crispata]|uniref:Uncharacterized protein n=1 Tax=Elysia crispata TaxID=231223 RepID=A0AAE1E621_9GAST|nr:hypothetical protein RRG08_049603 [Elysia crispata]